MQDTHGASLGAAYYHGTNRGKRAVTADFRNATDLAAVRRLAAGADILIENLRSAASSASASTIPRSKLPRCWAKSALASISVSRR